MSIFEASYAPQRAADYQRLISFCDGFWYTCVVVAGPHFWTWSAIEGVHHFPIAHNDGAHGADAAGAAVSGFEV